MSKREGMAGWRRKLVAAAITLAYALLVTGGVIGATWPPAYALDGWAFIVTRASGMLALVASLLAGYAQLRQRWLLELEALPAVGLGLTGYVAVLLLYVGPQREWVLMSALILALLCFMSARVVVLEDKAMRRTRAQRDAQELGD